MGIDTVFYTSYDLDNIGDEQKTALVKDWKHADEIVLTINGFEYNNMWKLSKDAQSIKSKENYRTGIKDYAIWFMFLHLNILKHLKDVYVTNSVSFSTSWGDSESGVVYLQDDLLRITKTSCHGDVTVLSLDPNDYVDLADCIWNTGKGNFTVKWRNVTIE